jgi:two-component system invasion response regulator UvrY
MNILIADDDKFFRIGLKHELNKFQDIHIIGEAINGDDLMILLRQRVPDVLLLDLNMPKLSGMDVLEIARLENIPVKSIIISSDDDELGILQAIQSGAKGFLVKGIEVDTKKIYEAIKIVYEGKFYFSELTNNILLKDSMLTKAKTGKQNRVIEFTESELEIILLLSLELTSKQIASKTRYSNRSLENKRQELVHRVEARTSIGLILYAIKHGFINVDQVREKEIDLYNS